MRGADVRLPRGVRRHRAGSDGFPSIPCLRGPQGGRDLSLPLRTGAAPAASGAQGAEVLPTLAARGSGAALLQARQPWAPLRAHPTLLSRLLPPSVWDRGQGASPSELTLFSSGAGSGTPEVWNKAFFHLRAVLNEVVSA